jgi:hypothetical protein
MHAFLGQRDAKGHQGQGDGKRSSTGDSTD